MTRGRASRGALQAKDHEAPDAVPAPEGPDLDAFLNSLYEVWLRPLPRAMNAVSATLTVRLPKGLKRLVADEAACRARGLADLVRERLYDAVCAPASAASHQGSRSN